MSRICFDKIKEFVDEYEMISPGDAVVVGVSGGADSVALLRFLTELREYFASGGDSLFSGDASLSGKDVLGISVVHINHMIRGEEADRDQSFVENLCNKLGVKCVVYKNDIPAMAKEKHLTEEEAGRLYRYECFEKQAAALEETRSGSGLPGRVHIAVAHNKDDLAETVLYNMIRGSSLFGLSGIRPVRDRIIRPLLLTSRRDIEEYLKDLGQDYITDSTNLVPDYTRNKIRLNIMPQLSEINDSAVDHMVDIAIDSWKLRDDINKETKSGYNKSEKSENEVRIEINRLLDLSELARGELVLSAMEAVCGRRKDITREHISAVTGLTGLQSGKRVDLPYNMVAERVYDEIAIYTADEVAAAEGDLGFIEVSTFPYSDEVDLSKKEYTKLIDCDKIKTALCLRTAQEGDFIVINSQGGTKKLSRLFTDLKIERKDRMSVPVVVDGDEVVWIVGYRLSERYKVSRDTKTVAQIRYMK